MAREDGKIEDLMGIRAHIRTATDLYLCLLYFLSTKS